MVKQSLEDRYSKFKERVPELKETIKFCIFLKEDKVGGMSFDISRTSSKSFTKSDFDNFHSFQKLMNSLYEINYLNNKNITLKNDGVEINTHT